jgi:hypothetical protein
LIKRAPRKKAAEAAQSLTLIFIIRFFFFWFWQDPNNLVVPFYTPLAPIRQIWGRSKTGSKHA